MHGNDAKLDVQRSGLANLLPLGWNIRASAQRVRRSKFVANVLKLASGTFVAQAVMVAAAPVLTRLYTPEDFAIYALFAVGANLVPAIATGRYELALMLPRREIHAARLALIALASPIAVVATLSAVAMGLARWLVTDSQSWMLGTWLWFVPAGVLLSCWIAVAHRWQARKQRFRSIAIAEMVACITAVAVQIGLGLTIADASGVALIGGVLGGQCLAAAILARDLVPDLKRYATDYRRAAFESVARRYWRFPAFSAGIALLTRATHEIPKLMLAVCFGPHVLGLFLLCRRVLETPACLLGQSVGKVFFAKISQTRRDEGRCRTLLIQTTSVLALIITTAMIPLLLWSEEIFSLLFGEQWSDAGHYCRLLIPMVIARFVVAPIGLSLQAFEKQSVVLLIQITWLALTAAALYLGHLRGDASLAILGFSIVSSIMYGAYLVASLYFANPKNVIRATESLPAAQQP